MNKPDTMEHARRLARAAIALDGRPQTYDDRPDDDTVRQWASGQLSAAQAQQLTLQALQDPALMQRFRQFKDNNRKRGPIPMATAFIGTVKHTGYDIAASAQEHIKSLSLWGRSNKHLAGGLTVASLVVGVFALQGGNVMTPPQEPWQQQAVIKSDFNNGSAGPLSSEHLGLLLGIGDVLPDIAKTDTLQLDSRISSACSLSDETCRDRLAAMRSIGQLAANTDQSCREGTQVNVNATDQIKTVIDLLADLPSAERFMPPLQRWQNSESTDRYCASAADLIERATHAVQ
ncbi:MAG: hypothetical protein AB8B63_20570 [Granulosicoccus sp.]